jgi:hypothetical protein
MKDLLGRLEELMRESVDWQRHVLEAYTGVCVQHMRRRRIHTGYIRGLSETRFGSIYRQLFAKKKIRPLL